MLGFTGTSEMWLRSASSFSQWMASFSPRPMESQVARSITVYACRSAVKRSVEAFPSDPFS